MNIAAGLASVVILALQLLAIGALVWLFFAGPTLLKRQKEIPSRLDAIDRRLAALGAPPRDAV
jgi:hypothetical protein